MEVRAKIEIVLSKDGQVALAAPLNDKILCYGILELARQLVANHDPEKGKPLVAGVRSIPRLPPMGLQR